MFEYLQFITLLGEPQKDFRFKVFILGASVKVLYRIKSIDCPFLSINYDESHNYKRITYIPERLQFNGNISIEFYESEDNAVKTWYNNWIQSIYNSDGTRNLPVEYEKQVILTAYSGLGLPLIFADVYTGCVPESMSSVKYDQEGKTIIMRTVVIRPSAIILPPSPFSLLSNFLSNSI